MSSTKPFHSATILAEEKHSQTSKGNEAVLKKPTKNTAKWIVSEQVSTEYQYKARLPSVLKDQFGSTSATDLLNDESKGKEDFYSVSKSSTDPKSLQSCKPETPLPVYYKQVYTRYNHCCCSIFFFM